MEQWMRATVCIETKGAGESRKKAHTQTTQNMHTL